LIVDATPATVRFEPIVTAVPLMLNVDPVVTLEKPELVTTG
jgi:hypothetical protein